jgi:hypothetical protein
VSVVVTLVRTDDPWTKLRPGDRGVLVARRTVLDDEVVDVAWEDGSSLSLIRGHDEWHEEVAP